MGLTRIRKTGICLLCMLLAATLGCGSIGGTAQAFADSAVDASGGYPGEGANTVVEVQLGDFAVRAEALCFDEETGVPVVDEDRVRQTFSFDAATGVLTIGSAAAESISESLLFTVGMAQGVDCTSNTIVVKDISFAAIDFDGVCIVAANGAALRIDESVSTEVMLGSEGAPSTFTGAEGFAGIQKGGNAALRIYGADFEAVGGTGAAGIGAGLGAAGSSTSGIWIEWSKVRARGGEGAAGIGAGKAQTGDSSASGISIESGSTVFASGGAGGAGIGAGLALAGSSIAADIAFSASAANPSDVTANGGIGAAGVGSGCALEGDGSASGGSIATAVEIGDGSEVRAQGGDGAAGVGSGWAQANSKAEAIDVDGGTVEATGGAGSPGIGGGSGAESALFSVTVHSGTVRAQGGGSLGNFTAPGSGDGSVSLGAGPGIGSGCATDGNSRVQFIEIDDGTVQATAGADELGIGAGAGIGGGAALAEGKDSSAIGIVVSGGETVARGGTTAAAGAGPAHLPGIGAGSGAERYRQTDDIMSVQPRDGYWANVWMGADAGSATLVHQNCADALPFDADDLDGYPYLRAVVTPEAVFAVTGGASEVDSYGNLVLTESASYRISMADGSTVSHAGIVVADGTSPTIVLDGVHADTSEEAGAAAFRISSGAGAVKILLSGENVLKSGRGCAGLQKDNNAAFGDTAQDKSRELVITSSAGDGSTEGSLSATGGYGGAGIGSGLVREGDNVLSDLVIKGGTIAAQSGAQAAAIGSGCASGAGANSEAQYIAIEGGTVAADAYVRNAIAGAAIGSGAASQTMASHIFISGGSVDARGTRSGSGGAAIGSGATISSGHYTQSTARDIVVSDGNVSAISYLSGAGIGSGTSQGSSGVVGIAITGGTVHAESRGMAPGIGSGFAEIRSYAEDISIAGGVVESIGKTGGSGIGSGGVLGSVGSHADTDGASETHATEVAGLVITGGDVTAIGTSGGFLAGSCSYEAPAFGPSQVSTVPEDGILIRFEGGSIQPPDGWTATLWTGDSAETAALVHEGAQDVDLTAIGASFAHVVFKEAAPGKDDGTGASGETPPKSLAATGDGVPFVAGAFTILSLTALIFAVFAVFRRASVRNR